MIGLIAVIIGLALLFLIFKYHKVHSFINFMIAGLILFVVLSFAYVYFNNPADVGTFNGLIVFLNVYVSWLASLLSTTGRTIGYVVHQNWTASLNSTVLP